MALVIYSQHCQASPVPHTAIIQDQQLVVDKEESAAKSSTVTHPMLDLETIHHNALVDSVGVQTEQDLSGITWQQAGVVISGQKFQLLPLHA
ncbi:MULTISPECIES: hypothetical protein [Caldilinea]|jgi:hypothetical protein|uniref:hypothetical protein n=1 Tax=Caldilinea TaxID=233191 RepID=UPI001396713C|nr:MULTISPECIES: hypothetical protein [Caldilinea]GIV74447.1 MAG: hypothetical protein KatS3mg049_3003 [Caldilinea sp.]